MTAPEQSQHLINLVKPEGFLTLFKFTNKTQTYP